jgi:hypothetical protein
VVYRDATRQTKGLYRLKYVGALWSGLVCLSRYSSGWFCHNKSLTDQDQVEMVQPRILFTLEEDLDHPPPLGEGEATACWGAIVSDNYSDSATHVTRGLARGLD